MDYYKQKIRVFNYIKSAISQSETGVNMDFLYYNVLQNFGFGETTVKKIVQNLENVGFCETKDGVVKWKNP